MKVKNLSAKLDDWEASLRTDLMSAKRILVKVGTSIVTSPDRLAAIGRIAQIVEQICQVKERGREILLVSSGAVGLGRKILIAAKPEMTLLRQTVGSENSDQIEKRASAAIGQARLMALYDTLFSYKNVSCSQILLTNDDLDGCRITNLKQTCEYLLGLGVVPILNENDVTNLPAGLNRNEGPFISDNDALACRLAGHLNVHLVLLLTDVDGVYTLPPSIPGAQVIRTIRSDLSHTIHTSGSSEFGRGGMTAKIDATEHAISTGVPAIVIASGYRRNTLTKVLDGVPVGTLIIGPPQAKL